MSAFAVDPMDAQKPWQVSLGPLLRLGALEKYIHISAAPKLAKSLTKAKLNKMGGTAQRWGTKADVSLCCGPNGCPKAVANVTRAIASPWDAGKIYSHLSSSKASKVPNKS